MDWINKLLYACTITTRVRTMPETQRQDSRTVAVHLQGVAPFGQDMALLTQIHSRDPADAASATADEAFPEVCLSCAHHDAVRVGMVYGRHRGHLTVGSADAVHLCVQLKILSWRGDELASDVLPIAGVAACSVSAARAPQLTGSLCRTPCNCSTLTTPLGPGLLDNSCDGAGLERGSGADAAALLACYYPLSKDRTLRADRRLTAPRKAEYKWWPDGYEPLYYVVTPRVSGMCCCCGDPC